MIVTFEPHGVYYHPDHLAIQRATTAAFFSSSVMGGEAPERLFYTTMLRDVFRGLADASRGRGIIDGLDPDVFATAPEMIAVSFDASPYLDRKFSALAAHRSAGADRVRVTGVAGSCHGAAGTWSGLHRGVVLRNGLSGCETPFEDLLRRSS